MDIALLEVQDPSQNDNNRLLWHEIRKMKTAIAKLQRLTGQTVLYPKTIAPLETCMKCGEEMSEQQAKISKKTYNRPFCIQCMKELDKH